MVPGFEIQEVLGPEVADLNRTPKLAHISLLSDQINPPCSPKERPAQG
jgi:hypothetical protein